MNFPSETNSFPAGRGVLPAHAAGLAKEELAFFHAGAPLHRYVSVNPSCRVCVWL